MNKDLHQPAQTGIPSDKIFFLQPKGFDTVKLHGSNVLGTMENYLRHG